MATVEEDIAIGSIHVNGRHRRDLGDVGALADSINAIGLLHPIVLTNDRKLIAGERRLEAAKKLGWTTIRATIADNISSAVNLLIAERDENTCRKDFSPSEAVAVGSALEELEGPPAEDRKRSGKSADGSAGGRGKKKPSGKLPQGLPGKTRDKVAAAVNMSGRTYEKAKKVVAAAEKHPEKFKAAKEEMDRTGNVAAADRFVMKALKKAELEEKAKKAPASKADWSIIHGDCVKELHKLPAKSARLIFADPPYNLGFDYGDGEAADSLSDDDYMKWVGRWARECDRVLTDDGSLFVMICDEYAGEYAVLLKSLGLTIRNWIIWHETFGVNCTNKFNRCHRHIFYAVKNPKSFTFNVDEPLIRRESDRQAIYGDKRASADGKLLDDVWSIPRLTGTAAERIPDFPTQLPVELVKRIVAAASNAGDVVIDPFNGSGTTGAACITLGRSYIGIEKQKAAHELATLRLKGMA